MAQEWSKLVHVSISIRPRCQHNPYQNRRVSKPVYYVSKILLEVEVRYLPLEKIALVLMHAPDGCRTIFKPT